MPQSITNTAASLGISKVKMYSMMRKHGIEATPSGNRKLITDDQYDHLCELLRLEGRDPVPSTDSGSISQSVTSSDTVQSATSDHYLKELLAGKNQEIERISREKDDQVKWLTNQLESEKLERQNLQSGLINLQGAMLKLDQRISLLQPPEKADSVNINDVEPNKGNFEDMAIDKNFPHELGEKKRGNYASTTVWLVLFGVAIISAYELGGGSASELLRDWLTLN